MIYITLSLLFILGYIVIIFEKFLHVNKAAIALLMAGIGWVIFFSFHQNDPKISQELSEVIASVAQIIFFLLAAMAIVELIDSHHGFKMITDIIYTSSKRKMLWFLLLISFFMSAILDNLTSMIVMVSLLRKLIPDREDRWFYGSMIVICVNAGGAWTPIGDVTTTLLWINDTITTWQTIKTLFLPSVVNVLAAGLVGMLFIKGENKRVETKLGHLPMEPGAKKGPFHGSYGSHLDPFLESCLGCASFYGSFIRIRNGVACDRYHPL